MGTHGPGYTLHPVRRPPDPASRPAPPGDGTEVVLSRFAVIHRDGERMLLESPLAWCDVEIHDPALLARLAALAQPVAPAGGPDRFLTDLWGAGLIVLAEGAEETELRLRQWSPFELWLHHRSRLGLRTAFNGSWGATGWAAGRFAPLPARHPPFDGPAVALHRPDLDALRAADPTLTAVIEDRRSIREHDDARPLTVAQLGEFLFRCARVRAVTMLDGVEHMDRPFPSGGALHELEIYPAVRNVAGLAPGLYHYDPHGHELRWICGDTGPVRRLIHAAELATRAPAPQAVLVIAARFGRLMSKYEGMGYAAILKNVGVLYQVMYSAATAMGLAPCAIGGGDAEVFNDATGLDYAAESVVGEFQLGSRRSDIP